MKTGQMLAESSHVCWVDIRVFENHDRLSFACDRFACVVQRGNVVDSGQVRRRFVVELDAVKSTRTSVAGKREVWGRFAQRRLRHKVMQSHETHYHRRQGRGDLRIARIGDMLFAVHQVIVNLGVKCLPHLSGCARDIDGQSIFRNLIHLESMSLAIDNGIDVLLRGAELPSQFLGGEPG